MAFAVDHWQRFHHASIPVWVDGATPQWLVPNRAGDAVLRRLQAGTPLAELDLDARLFVERLPESAIRPYTDRRAHLSHQHLRELWFHLTDRCNLSCRHCLFASSPAEGRELSTERVCARADEAHDLGCRVVAFTGGEPFVHPGFPAIVDHLLARDDTHVVVLTNAVLLDEHRGHLARWPRDRFHLQISVDGQRERHDHLRGTGSFDRLRANLTLLRDLQYPFTLSTCVTADTAVDMPAMVDLAAAEGAANLHYMWYFIRGRGTEDGFLAPDAIAEHLAAAEARAAKLGVAIDNRDALAGQVFAPPGTRFDGTNAGWEAAAIGPDDRLYPTAATVGVADLATPLDQGLARAW